jgi:HlyD family secretion protein
MKLLRTRGDVGIAVLTIATIVATAWMVWYVVLPGYAHPSNRTYTSQLGYPAVLRKLNEPFPVTTARVEERSVSGHYLAEGVVQSEPVQVPIVAVARIARIHVKEGDTVKQGQLLAELDPQSHEIKIAMAKASIAKANAQLERAKIGSPNPMTRERPDIDEANLEAAREAVTISKELIGVYERLANSGAEPRELLLKEKLAHAKATADVRVAEADLKMSQAGRPLSIEAAELAIREAELTLRLRMEELKGYKIAAIADGVVQRVLVHEGEYNQTPGNPAVVLAVGKWFGGNFDQVSAGRFPVGAAVTVHLEAFPGRDFPGRVAAIKPFVTYGSGGPEASRPIRPLGTGSPEWPATFATRIEFEGSPADVIPGLTGFADVKIDHYGPAVRSGTLTSVSAGKGIAYVVDGDGFKPQEVVTGLETDGWVEILSGLKPGMEVITDGYQVLKPGDRISVSSTAEVHNASLIRR